jgi:hypothetical protein
MQLEKLYALFFFVVTTLAIAVAAYWLWLQPSDVLTNIRGDVLINGSDSYEVVAGSTMTLSRYFCINTTDHNGKVSRAFINHVVYELPDTNTTVFKSSPGCQRRDYVIDVPAVLPTGEYVYKVRIEYHINPLKSRTFELTPVKLKVTNPVWDKALGVAKQ